MRDMEEKMSLLREMVEKYKICILKSEECEKRARENSDRYEETGETRFLRNWNNFYACALVWKRIANENVRDIIDILTE